MDLTIPLLVGALVGAASPGDEIAEREAAAEQLEADGSLALAAATWEEVMEHAQDSTARSLAAYRAQKAFREAAMVHGQEGQLCRAEAVIARLLVRDDVAAEERADFEGFKREVQTALIDGEIDCGPVDVEAFLPLDAETLAPAAPNKKPSLAHDALPPVSPPRGGVTEDKGQRPRGRQIAGGVLVGAGIGLVGLATYGLLEDYRAAQEIWSYVPKNNSAGLTDAEASAVNAAKECSAFGSHLALGAGISAGATLITGVLLLALPSRQRRPRSLSVSPQPRRRSVGLSLRGTF